MDLDSPVVKYIRTHFDHKVRKQPALAKDQRLFDVFFMACQINQLGNNIQLYIDKAGPAYNCFYMVHALMKHRIHGSAQSSFRWKYPLGYFVRRLLIREPELLTSGVINPAVCADFEEYLFLLFRVAYEALDPTAALHKGPRLSTKETADCLEAVLKNYWATTPETEPSEVCPIMYFTKLLAEEPLYIRNYIHAISWALSAVPATELTTQTAKHSGLILKTLRLMVENMRV